VNPDYAQLLMLCIFTGGQRPWELMTNTHDNWDKNNSTLIIPHHISKTGDYHVVPLCLLLPLRFWRKWNNFIRIMPSYFLRIPKKDIY